MKLLTISLRENIRINRFSRLNKILFHIEGDRGAKSASRNRAREIFKDRRNAIEPCENFYSRGPICASCPRTTERNAFRRGRSFAGLRPVGTDLLARQETMPFPHSAR